MLKPDLWLSEILGYPAYYVEGNADRLEVCDLPAEKSFVSAKIRVNAREELSHLQNLGFRVITVNANLYCSELISVCEHNTEILRTAIPTDELVVKQIASESFANDRFHADDKLCSSIADKVKEKWVSSYFTGARGDELFVIQIQGVVVGFLLAMKSRDSAFAIDLLAIHRQWQGKNFATQLLHFANGYYSEKSTKKGIVVGTQLSNICSLAFYRKNGFLLESASYVLHLHKHHDFS